MRLKQKLAYIVLCIMASFPTGNAIALAENIIPVKTIGALVPLSGQNASIGTMLVHAMQMAWFDFAPKTMRLKFFDTQSSKVGTKIAYQKALNQGIKIFIGPLSASNTETVKSYDNADVIHFSLSNTVGVSAPNIYVAGYTPQSQGVAMVKILEKIDIQRAIAILPRSPLGKAFEEGLQSDRHGRIIESFYYNPLFKDFKGLVEYIKDRKDQLQFDAIVLPDPTPNIIRTLSAQLAYYNVVSVEEGEKNSIPIIGGIGWQALQGAYREPPLIGGYYIKNPESDAYKEFEKMYKHVYKSPPPPLVKLTYDMATLAIVAVDSERPREIIKQQQGFKGVSGVFTLENPVVSRTYDVMQVMPHRSVYQFSVSDR